MVSRLNSTGKGIGFPGWGAPTTLGGGRFTLLTNAFSKKVENLAHAVCLHFIYYNFGRTHKSLRVTPAMEAGVTDHVWTLEEIAGLLN